MEQASTTYDFASYIIPAWLRTRVTLSDDQIEVRCPAVWGPIPTSRVLYRFSLAKITGIHTEHINNPLTLGLAAASLVIGPVVALAWARSGAILVGVAVAVALVVLAALAAVAGSRTRVWLQTEHDGRVWFDVASTEHHEVVRFGHWLLHEASLAAGRRVPEETAQP